MHLPVPYHHEVAALVAKFDQIPALTKEEEFELAVRLREQGDVDAAHRLITANLRNVVRIAMDYAGYGLPLEDIIQEGTIGLMIAVKKYDPHKGYRLMTYAVWWIKAMIHDYILRFFSQVKLGTTKLQKKLFYGLNRMSSEEEVNHEPIGEQSRALSARLDADPRRIEEIISRLTGRDQSLDTPMAEDSDSSFLDFLADTRPGPEDRVIESQRSAFVKRQIESALAKLTEREREIARHRLMAEQPMTLEDLGRRFSISKERVRQIENAAKGKLKKALAGNLELMLQ
ncbi:MAG TPA: RNA polymerase factor sigma-32 [Deltaproteobacteria bacterium]|nr:RNA polymerase factor sigma-32 [Deltaproteobacteria bacterium]HOM29103.1 RNA polymerase factor sigma-32 [Deltaproteobacteria bacterium]HPP80037.1 RNA polymerase factor sigma-32 [Deltaproteobacteria bacterium]